MKAGIAAIAILGGSSALACCGGERPRPAHVVDLRDEPGAEQVVEHVAAEPVARDLGSLPTELSALRWPEPPRIEREVEASTASELQRAIDVAGTRVRVHGTITEPVTVHASDVEIVGDARSVITKVMMIGVHRVRVIGGRVDSIELTPPARWDPDAHYDIALLSTDVMIRDVHMVAADSALVIRGRRVAVIDSDVTAERYSLWSGDTGPIDQEDLIVAGNTFRSAGPEATFRIHDVIRSVVVDNVLSNTLKHNYRVHGRSDLAFASRNVLLGTGVMVGNQPGDHVGTILFVENVIHLETLSLFGLDIAGITRLVCRDNIAYSDRVDSFYGEQQVPAGWVVEHNQRLPYRAYAPVL